MMPFYFGTRERRLFGVYDPARMTDGASRAAVICPPWGSEYIHAHRTLRQLAARLSQNGFHVLRFDYYGTGDSGGDTDDNDHAGSRDDVATAISELKDLSGAARTTVVGLRFGACVAAEVSAIRANEVDKLVLWDPIIADNAEKSASAEHFEAPKGFANPDLATIIDELSRRTLVVTTQDERPSAFGSLSVKHVASKPPWIEELMESGTIPVNVLQCITSWLR